MPKELHIDFETYSSEELKDVGAYKYVESPDFEILLIAYCLDGFNVEIADLTDTEEMPVELVSALQDRDVEKHAHNATFERLCLQAIGIHTDASEWRCSAVKSSYCGYPISLDGVSMVMRLGDKAKSKTGKDLIKYFCKPIKPTKANGMRRRNLPKHNPEAWEEFKDYCVQDVVAEMAVGDRLSTYEIPAFEQTMYALDQRVNDRGLAIDTRLATAAIHLNDVNKKYLLNILADLTGLDNPNSQKQLTGWLSEKLGKQVKSIAKDNIAKLLENAPAEVVEVLNLRSMTSKTSVKKYTTLIASLGYDNRSRGHLQFYGAGRTGRWAGRLAQVHNLPRNYLDDLDQARHDVKTLRFDDLRSKYDNIADLLSQLIRTAFISAPGKSFSVADYSAIEARIVAWICDEHWRQDIFATHGKIYEASAARMFDIDIDDVTGEQRQKGKIAELALGYGGSTGAMENMGASGMGLTYEETKEIVSAWRKANPGVTSFWKELNKCAIRAIKTGKKIKTKNGLITFGIRKDRALIVVLPSGRWLVYRDAKIGENKFGSESVQYKGLHQKTNTWVDQDTYGGKLLENIAQAIARDIMAIAIYRAESENIPIVLHVHDEVVAEVDDVEAEPVLSQLCDIMSEDISWAPGLILRGEGFVSKYYKK